MATVARTKQDVDEMTRQERLWDSLNHAYGKQREATNKEYDKAISQADRQMLGRGMQRSSFNSQVLGNLSNQKINAQDESWNNQIAKYEEGLMTLDQQDAENERWEKQFNEGVRQFNENLAWQSGEREKERAYNTSEREAQQLYNTGEREAQQAWQAGQNELARAFQTSEREAQQKYNTSEREAQQGWQSGENERNRAYNTAEREAQQKYNTAEREAQQGWQSGENALARAFQAGEREAQQAYNTSERIAQQLYNTTEREAQQLYNTGEREAQQAFQSGENALTRAENARQFNEQMAYNNAQADRSADQWERQFAQNNMTDDQKLAASYVSAIVANGQVPSDELLARAGLSRADAELMAKQAASSGRSGPGKSDDDGGNNTPPGNTPPGSTDNLFSDDLLSRLKGAWDNIGTQTPATPRVTDADTKKLQTAFNEAKQNNFADLPVVDFSGKSATGWTDRDKNSATQNVGVAMNTEEIKKRKKESESLVNKPHINI